MAQIKNYIKKIYVENLFGYYTYTIPKEEFDNSLNPIMIIYGDNGSGKTTIFQLIFNLLSTIDNAGHKSKIAAIKFSKISVSFENGITIVAQRNEPVIGTYEIAVFRDNNELVKVPLKADEDNSITMSSQTKAEQEKFNRVLQIVSQLNISIFFLTDKREIASTILDEQTKRVYEKRTVRRGDIHYLIDTTNKGDEDVLEIAVKNLENWIRKQVIQGARKGERDVNGVYNDIVNRITTTKKAERNIKVKSVELKAQFEEIRKRSNMYFKTGLISKIESRQLEDILENTQSQKLQVIYSVLQPYAESLKARLDSLQHIQDLIILFTSTINSYFKNKILEYHHGQGITLKYLHSNEPIKISMLSSGERQLLLLICNVITATEKATIFIIDEPEISLNVQWQRKLADTLLLFSKGKNVQFILATHSIELLTKQKDSVSKLINEKVF